jgi:hypothetical protein
MDAIKLPRQMSDAEILGLIQRYTDEAKALRDAEARSRQVETPAEGP